MLWRKKTESVWLVITIKLFFQYTYSMLQKQLELLGEILWKKMEERSLVLNNQNHLLSAPEPWAGLILK